MDHPLDFRCHPLQFVCNPFEVEGEGELINEVVVEMVGEVVIKMVREVVVHLSRHCLIPRHGALKACNLYCFMKTIFYI